ncbi:transposase [Candidatus Woesearchaeota archaeon]|nr:transposase [Candidatus Woesearchaeota archaeon]
MGWIQKGNKFLLDISKEELKKLYKNEKNAKAKLRLLASMKRKEGMSMDEIANSLQKPKTTIHDWLQRIENRGIKNIYDIKQSGKPPKLTKKQLEELKNILRNSPEEQDIPFTLWTTNLVQYIIMKNFNVELKVRQVRNIIKKINFTLQKPRPENKKANKKLREEFKKNLKKKFNIIVNSDLRSSVLTNHSSK